MTSTRQQFGTALLVALLLHGVLAAWMTLPEPLPDPPRTLNLSLLMPVAEKTVAKATPPPTEPAPKPKPKPLPETPLPQEPVPLDPPPETVTAEPPPIVAETAAPLDAAAAIRYEQLLVAWLEKHKQYPRRAKRLRIQGQGMLRIRIDRSGHTQLVALEQRTGNRMLDKAAMDMARRANPFPPFPDGDPRRELEFVVPVVFALR